MIKRTLYLDKIRPFIDKKIIKVLTGVRRSGKSILLEQIKDELLSLNVSFTQVLPSLQNLHSLYVWFKYKWTIIFVEEESTKQVVLL